MGLSRTLARLGHVERALDTLTNATTKGFRSTAFIETHADLASLRSHERFPKILAAADKNARPCQHDPLYRAFDFWIGEWEVTANGVLAGHSRIEPMLKGCVIFENWTGAGGGAGKSFNFYDTAHKRWQQTWVSSSGRVAPGNFTPAPSQNRT